MRTRKHHNNYGKKRIKSGKVKEDMKNLAKKLNIPFRNGRESRSDNENNKNEKK